MLFTFFRFISVYHECHLTRSLSEEIGPRHDILGIQDLIPDLDFDCKNQPDILSPLQDFHLLLKSLTRPWTAEETKFMAENVELQFEESLSLKDKSGQTGFVVRNFYVTVQEIPNYHKYPCQE